MPHHVLAVCSSPFVEQQDLSSSGHLQFPPTGFSLVPGTATTEARNTVSMETENALKPEGFDGILASTFINPVIAASQPVHQSMCKLQSLTCDPYQAAPCYAESHIPSRLIPNQEHSQINSRLQYQTAPLSTLEGMSMPAMNCVNTGVGLHPIGLCSAKVEATGRHVISSSHAQVYSGSQADTPTMEGIAFGVQTQSGHPPFRGDKAPCKMMFRSPNETKALLGRPVELPSSTSSEQNILAATVAAVLLQESCGERAQSERHFNGYMGSHDQHCVSPSLKGNEYPETVPQLQLERHSSCSSTSSLSVKSLSEWHTNPAQTPTHLIPRDELCKDAPAIAVKTEGNLAHSAREPQMQFKHDPSQPQRPPRRRRRPPVGPTAEKIQREQLRRNERLASELRRENASLRREEKALREKLERVREKIILKSAGEQVIPGSMAVALCPTVVKPEPS